jgi:AraC-like DNA-binding protein
VRHKHRAYGTTRLHTIGLDRRANPLRLRAPTVLEVSPLLRELFIAYAGEPGDTSRRRARLRAVLIDELRASPQRGLHLPTPRDDRLAAVCALLAGDPADSRTLAQLGRAVGVGQRTLTRLFADELGLSFRQWRTQLRLHLALRLLAEGQSVTATGHRCGWASTSAFVDVFRRHLGHTPGDFSTKVVRISEAPATPYR